MILVFGAILGFISIAFGAYSEHVLKYIVTPESFNSLLKALQYNQLYSILISAIGLTLLKNTKLRGISILRSSGVLFIIGTIMFSFSIYFAILLHLPYLTKITPFGGILIMISWLFLFVSGIYSFFSKR